MMKSKTAPDSVSRVQRDTLTLMGRIRANPLNYTALGVISLIFCILSILYFVNLLHWSSEPEFGWAVGSQIGGLEIIHLTAPASSAGLKVGDRFLSVNGQPVASLQEVREQLDRTAVGENVYEVLRQGDRVTVVVKNRPKGFRVAFLNYGLTWLLGILSFVLGAVVFYMKPGTRASWAYLLATFSAGLFITFSMTSKLNPSWLYRALTFGATFSAAAILQLASVFPAEWRWVKGRRFPVFAAYSLSAGLFLAISLVTAIYTDAPRHLVSITEAYRGLAMLFFIGLVSLTFFRTKVPIEKVRARIILIGAVIALFVPAVDLFVKMIFRFPLIPHPAFYLPFYIFFPLSVAYAIARHNLFDVDVFIKRTVGYVLMTVLVGLVYFGLQVSVRSLVTRSAFAGQAETIYPIFFALLVVFLFNPVNRRVQGAVDRLFYRQKFDYKETVISVSNALTTMLNVDQIFKQIINTIRKEMFIDSAGVIMLRPDKNEYQALFVEGEETKKMEKVREEDLSPDDPLVSLVSGEKKMVTRFDVEENPAYREVRKESSRRFAELGATLALPLTYQDRVTGILTVGQKKSGRFYSSEDIDLLKTLTNQGAVALENARLFEENLEKGRMEEELKIAHDLQTSMLPEKAPEIEGFQIAASSVSAREVGGDFYDFIRVGDEKDRAGLGIVIADVSGKAVSGALVMSAARSVLRFLADGDHKVSEMMKMANFRLSRDIRKGMFVALIFALLDPMKRTLTVSNAGQTQPVFCSAEEKEPFFIETEGDRFPLGIVPECDYRETSLPLQNGDLVVLYTDGVVEAQSVGGEMYGFERLIAFIAGKRDLGAAELLEEMNRDLEKFTEGAEQHDDITFVVIRAV